MGELVGSVAWLEGTGVSLGLLVGRGVARTVGCAVAAVGCAVAAVGCAVAAVGCAVMAARDIL